MTTCHTLPSPPRIAGISAYFPLTSDGRVTEQQARAAWTTIHDELEAFSKQAGRAVCFTEIGYTASSRAGSHPWEDNEVEQDRHYQAMLWRVALEEAAGREFLVGLFGWKWFTGDRESALRQERRDGFVLQTREPTIEVLRRAWGARK